MKPKTTCMHCGRRDYCELLRIDRPFLLTNLCLRCERKARQEHRLYEENRP